MNVIKKIFSFIFNPLSSLSFGKASEKLVEFFTKHPFMIFIVSLIVSALIFIVGHDLF